LNYHIDPISVGLWYRGKPFQRTGGAHEVSIVYEFNSKSKKEVKKKYRLIPCPTFNSKEGFWN
jgi:hypothetical protein